MVLQYTVLSPNIALGYFLLGIVSMSESCATSDINNVFYLHMQVSEFDPLI